MTPSDPLTPSDATPNTPNETPNPQPNEAGTVAASPAEPPKDEVPAAVAQAAPTDAPPPPEATSPDASNAPAAVAEPERAPERTREPALPSQPVPDVPPAPQSHDLSRIAQDLQIRKAQVEAVVQLLDDDNTVPFITRYRKERTGGLDEEFIRRIQGRVENLRALADRKRTIFKSIAFQGRLNDELVQAILAAESPKRLEDLYLPYKPKKKSKATEAREKGLGPLAEAIFFGDPAVANLNDVLPGLVDPDKWLLNTDDVLGGVKDILAEMVADAADVRGPLRAFTWDTGMIVAVRGESVPEGKGREHEPYFNFREPVKEIPPHRVLAVNRGEKANVLKVRLDTDPAMAHEIATYHLNLGDHPHRELMQGVLADALDRLVRPSLEREIRRELTERAQEYAIMVFAKNLRSLLLQPPLRGKKVLAVDPGIRTGCKLAVLDETGKMLEDAVVYPHGQRKNAAEAKRKMEQLIRKHQLSVIAIGNGTGCRETEQVVADLIAELTARRLNPTPPTAETVSAPVEEPTAPPASPESPPATPEPMHLVMGVPGAAETFGHGTFFPVEVVTLAADGGIPITETTHSDAPTPSTETLDTHGPHAAAPIEARPARREPLSPPISLEGLPDAPADLAYVIVIEAGASDYSASPVAREEFPELDATTRGTISIGRRLQDPLAELVKIDPQHIGVGLYQHDVKAKHLKESLEGVIESSVNQVGVDLNTASVPLLRHVSGLNQLVAREIVTHRDRNGPFTTREQLLQVSGLGDKRFTQAAGFLKLPDAADPLDTTWIHPESYPLARQILTDLGFTPADLRDRAKLDELRGKLNGVNAAELAGRLNAGEPTVRDIFDSLAKPGRDPREDLPPPIFKTNVLRLEDITPGMELKGTVLNVVPFGAFVDIGLKESGLVHISLMANRYIKSPYDVVAVGDVVNVWVKEVKPGEKKISLSMIPPDQERRPPERGGRFSGPPPGDGRGERGPGGPPQQQGERGGFLPRGDRSGERPGFQPRGGGDRGGERPGFQPRGGGDRGGFQQRGNQGQGQGQGQGGGNRFAGRGPGPGGPRPGQGQSGSGAPAGNAPPAGGQPSAPLAQPIQPPPPRKPSKPKPLPNLTADKKAGKAALNTFGELLAFFKPPEPEPEKKPEPPKEEPKPTPAATAEEPKPEVLKLEEPKPEEPKPEEPKPDATT